MRSRGMAALFAALLAGSAAHAAPSPRLEMRVSPLPITILYDPGSERAAASARKAVLESAPHIAQSFGLDSLPPLVLDLERNSAEFRRAAGGRAPDWGAAISFPSHRVAIFDLVACEQHPAGLAAVTRHELSHLLFGAATGGMAAPRWFEEGLAMWQASEWGLGNSWTLLEGKIRGGLPSLEELDAGFPASGRDADVAYTVSMRAVNGIMRSAPSGALADLAAQCRTAATFEEAFASVFGYRLEDYATRFSNELNRTFRWAAVASSVPVLFGFMSVLFLLAYGAKRIRAQRVLRRWADEDRAHPAPIIPFPVHRVPGVRPPAAEEQPPASSDEASPEEASREEPEETPGEEPH